MKQLFISYSRKDTDFARRLTDGFEAQNMEAWVDWQDIPPSVDWFKEIEKGIEEADIFIFLISPDSILSKVCADEVAHAIKNGKRIAPVVAREIDMKNAPPAITHLNWIFFSRPQDKFEESFDKLLAAIHTDYDWVQAHSKLQVKALEWERNQRETSFLLRGVELQDAQAQLKVNGEKQPRPTDLQREYIEKSAQAEAEEAERKRQKEQQLELEKKMATRLRRLTYVILGVFTAAFALLFLWLNTVTSNLAVNSIKGQMLALVETSVCFFNADGDGFQEFVDYFPAGDAAVYDDAWYSYISYLLADIKATNKNIDTQIEVYTIVPGEQANETLYIIGTSADWRFKDSMAADGQNGAHLAGMSQTTANAEPYTDAYGTWISACSPILNSQGESVGALCADFNAQLLEDTRERVTATLLFAFLAIYPAMIALVLFATRNAQKAKKKTP